MSTHSLHDLRNNLGAVVHNAIIALTDNPRPVEVKKLAGSRSDSSASFWAVSGVTPVLAIGSCVTTTLG